MMSPEEKQEFDKIMADLYKEEQKIIEKNNRVLEEVKKLINYPASYIDYALEELSSWNDEGFVEVELTEYKESGYSNYEFYRIKNSSDKRYYMKQDEDENFHDMVWQTTGCCEDDYSGYQLFPLKDGRYWKIYYNC